MDTFNILCLVAPSFLSPTLLWVVVFQKKHSGLEAESKQIDEQVFKIKDVLFVRKSDSKLVS